MRVALRSSVLALLALTLTTSRALAQGDPDRVIPNGGIFVTGWTGKIDPQSEKAGGKLANARFSVAFEPQAWGGPDGLEAVPAVTRVAAPDTGHRAFYDIHAGS